MWIKREISSKIAAAVSSSPVLILTGARQVGKTSLLRKTYPNYSFISLDLPTHADLAEKQPDEFLKRYPPPVVIDEVQYAPQLFRYLKKVVDDNRHLYGQFLLTGSQKFSLMKTVSDSLAGRCVVLELETLSWKESLSAGTVSDIAMVLKGGFPELHARSELDPFQFYQSYVTTYLERDVRSLLHVTQLRDFERFLRACALRSGQLLNKSELARDIGISPTTANEWLSVLEASNQVQILEPWFSNRTKSMIKSPKLYFSDTGLLCFLLGIDSEEILIRSPLIGMIWETFVYSELRKNLFFKEGRSDIWFWRDQYGLEADFLIHRGGRFQLFEAKFTERADMRDAKLLEKVAKDLGNKNVDTMTLLTRTSLPQPLSETVTALPLKSIFESL